MKWGPWFIITALVKEPRDVVYVFETEKMKLFVSVLTEQGRDCVGGGTVLGEGGVCRMIL